MLLRNCIPHRRLEQCIIDRCIIGAVLPADAKADLLLNVIGKLYERVVNLLVVLAEIAQLQVRADRCVTARDVEAHADYRHLVTVRGYATNRHDVADVTVSHQRGFFSTARDVVDLIQRREVMLTENLDSLRYHHSPLLPAACAGSGRKRAVPECFPQSCRYRMTGSRSLSLKGRLRRPNAAAATDAAVTS